MKNAKNEIFKINKNATAIILLPVILLISILAISTVSARPEKMELQALDLDGSNVNNGIYSGNVQIVEFMATWCTTCGKITNNIRELLKNDLVSEDVIFISITIDPSHDSSEVLNNYIDDHNIRSYVNDEKWVFLRDTESYFNYYQVTNVPHTFLVDKDQKIVDDHLGLLTQEDILDWISSLR